MGSIVPSYNALISSSSCSLLDQNKKLEKFSVLVLFLLVSFITVYFANCLLAPTAALFDLVPLVT